MLKIRVKVDMAFITNLIVSVGFALSQIRQLMYIALLLQIVKCLLSIKENRDKMAFELFKLVIVSVFMPDNYTIILVTVISCFIICPKIKVRTIHIFVLTYIVFNVLINSVHLGNLVMFLIYVIPFFILGYCMRIFSRYKEVTDGCCGYLKQWLLIEIVTVVLYALSHMDVVLSFRDLDWVTGTLGTYQCNVLMCVCAFTLLVFWTHSSHDKKNVIWMLLCVLLLLGTGAIAYTLVYLASIIFASALSINGGVVRKAATIGLLIIGIIAFSFIMPKWIIREMGYLTDVDYTLNRVTKIKYYENTFIRLPREEGWIMFLFGTGAGQYSSRAAETCSGGYISLYDQIASPFETEVRKKYISIGYGGKGLASSSESSILSIQGEFGLIGTIFTFACFVISLIRNKKTNVRIALVFFFGLMFLDNSIEFAKYGAEFWMAYYFCGNEDIVKTSKRSG